jgi:nucleoside-diphosphate-sugar epimerase
MNDGQGVLVTGGAGFVGATLVRRLVADGYRVRVLDNLSTGDPAHLNRVDAELVKGDIRDDFWTCPSGIPQLIPPGRAAGGGDSVLFCRF